MSRVMGSTRQVRRRNARPDSPDGVKTSKEPHVPLHTPPLSLALEDQTVQTDSNQESEAEQVWNEARD